MFPMLNIANEQKVHLAVCENCSVVRAINHEANATFPDSGYWIECPVCRTYTMYWRIVPHHGAGVFALKVSEPNNSQPMANRMKRIPLKATVVIE